MALPCDVRHYTTVERENLRPIDCQPSLAEAILQSLAHEGTAPEQARFQLQPFCSGEKFLDSPPMFQSIRNTPLIVIAPSVPRVTDTSLPSA